MSHIQTKLAVSAVLATGALALVGGGVNAAFSTAGSSDEAINAGTLAYTVSDDAGSVVMSDATGGATLAAANNTPLTSQFNVTKKITVQNTGTLNSQTFLRASDCPAYAAGPSVVNPVPTQAYKNYFLAQRTSVVVTQNGTQVYSGSYCQFAVGTAPTTPDGSKGENGTTADGSLARNSVSGETGLTPNLGRLAPGHLGAGSTDTYVFTFSPTGGALAPDAQGGSFTPTVTFTGRDRIAGS